MKPKVLVCVLAQTRSHETTWASFKRHVLDVLNADLALCVAKPIDYDINNPFWRFSTYQWTSPEYNDYGDAFDEALRSMNLKDTGWRKLLNVPDQWLGGIQGERAQPGSAAILIYFRWLLLKNIVEQQLHLRYDSFIITRSDFVWASDHPPVASDGAIWIPYGEGYGGYTDRHAIVPSRWVNTYLDLLSPVVHTPDALRESMRGQTSWNLERYIKFHLEQAVPRPQVKHFPFAMYSVRNKGGGTRWAAGTWNRRLGYFVKYPLELISAMSLNEALNDGGGWQSSSSVKETDAGYVLTGLLDCVSPGRNLKRRSQTCGAHVEFRHEFLSFQEKLEVDGSSVSALEVVPVPSLFSFLNNRDRAFMLRQGDLYVKITRSREFVYSRFSQPSSRLVVPRILRHIRLVLHLVFGGLFALTPPSRPRRKRTLNP